MLKKIFLPLLLIATAGRSLGQEARISDHNHINWLNLTSTFKLSKNATLHTEMQWRRTEGIKEPQQLLLRSSINLAVHKDVSLNIGYAFVNTYPYGDYPAIRTFPEHRLFEQLALKQQTGRWNFHHRLTLEQRFVGKPVNADKSSGFDYPFTNRFRYRLRAEYPFAFEKGRPKKWSLVAMDEFFIGWGKNAGANIFDQNRMGLFAGYQLSSSLKLEAGYLGQVLQQSRRINGNPVFQYNNGALLTAFFSFDLQKKKPS